MKKIQFYGQIRAIAMAVAGLLAHRGYITQSEIEQVTAITVGVAMMIWSWVEKRDAAAAPADLVRKASVLVFACLLAGMLSGCRDNRLLDLVIGDSNDESTTSTSTQTTEDNTNSKNDNSTKGAE